MGEPDPVPGHPKSMARKLRLEIPTLIVATAIYAGFFVWAGSFRGLPLWIAAPLGSLLLAWYGSLQHETIHGHPTSSRRVNTLLGSAPLSLWIPYGLYRDIHLRHHRYGGRHLTHPVHDTESFYLLPGAFPAMGGVRRTLQAANCSLAGRLILGPALSIHAVWASEIRKLRRGDRRCLFRWVRHALEVGVVLAWVVGVCGVPLLVYIGLVVYPSASLTQLRSFVEHRANSDPNLRTAVVEANSLWALIFLNNNLHIAHHAQPKLPWYQLPAAWRRMRTSRAGEHAAAGGMVFRSGYFGVMRAYLLRPFITVEHPALADEHPR